MATVSPSRTYVIEYATDRHVPEEERETLQVTLPKSLKNEAGIASAYGRRQLPTRSYIFGVRPAEDVHITDEDISHEEERKFLHEVSPAAMRMIDEYGFALAEITGTGKNGLITVKDVRNHIKSETEPEEEEDEDDLETGSSVERGGFGLLS